MNTAEEKVVNTAVVILEKEGIDVDVIRRELLRGSLSRCNREQEPPDLASLDLTLDAVLFDSCDPLYTLRKRGAALMKEIERLRLEYDRDVAQKESGRFVLLDRYERRELNRRIFSVKEQIAGYKRAQREVLEKTRDLSERKRWEESDHYYAAMRISKLGVRGESHVDS